MKDPVHKIDPTFISIDHAAARWDVSEATIRRAIDRGLLPALHVRGSRLVRLRVSDVDSLLAQPRTAPWKSKKRSA